MDLRNKTLSYFCTHNTLFSLNDRSAEVKEFILNIVFIYLSLILAILKAIERSSGYRQWVNAGYFETIGPGADPNDDMCCNLANISLNLSLPSDLRSVFNCKPTRMIYNHKMNTREWRFHAMGIPGITKWKKRTKQLLQQAKQHLRRIQNPNWPVSPKCECVYCRVIININSWIRFFKEDLKVADHVIREIKFRRLMDRKWLKIKSESIEKILPLVANID